MTSYSSSVSRIGSASLDPLGQNVSTFGVLQIRRHRGGLGMSNPLCFRYIPVILHLAEEINIDFQNRCTTGWETMVYLKTPNGCLSLKSSIGF
jgi:hypothetical protein